MDGGLIGVEAALGRDNLGEDPPRLRVLLSKLIGLLLEDPSVRLLELHFDARPVYKRLFTTLQHITPYYNT